MKKVTRDHVLCIHTTDETDTVFSTDNTDLNGKATHCSPVDQVGFMSLLPLVVLQIHPSSKCLSYQERECYCGITMYLHTKTHEQQNAWSTILYCNQMEHNHFITARSSLFFLSRLWNRTFDKDLIHHHLENICINSVILYLNKTFG